ncbi:MAG: MFS transporter [Deltaproteobacteria bacterium]|nr:MFS transporter [Deltaproteobacteria bacterium]
MGTFPQSLPLALFWFIYMGALGIFFPYYSLYLRENAGLSGTQVGLVLAMVPLVGMFAQPFWGQVADRTGARGRVLAALAVGASLGYLALASASGFPAIVATTVALASFSTAIIPMAVSVTLGMVHGSGPYAFGLFRVWGTLGYLLLVIAFPWFLRHYQELRGSHGTSGQTSEAGLEVMFLVTAALVLASALVGLFLPRKGTVALRAEKGDWRELFKNRAVIRFLFFVLVVYVLQAGPMWLFPLYVRARGGGLDTIRQMWILMLVIEIPLVMSSGAGLKRLGSRGLLALGLLAGAIRWTVSGLSHDLQVIYPVQILHGVMVTGLILGGPLYLDAVVPGRLRSTAQALLSVIGVGIGGIASNAGAGWLLQHVGADAPYIASGIGSLILGCLVWWILPSPESPEPQVSAMADRSRGQASPAEGNTPLP